MEDGVHGESEKVVHERVQGRGGEADSDQRQERRRRVARAWADRDERAGLGEESGDRREKGPAGPADERGAGGKHPAAARAEDGDDGAGLPPKHSGSPRRVPWPSRSEERRVGKKCRAGWSREE